MHNAAASPESPRTSSGSVKRPRGLPELRRHPVRHPDDYGIALPEWLRECIANVPPGIGQSCPTDPEALLVAAFDFGFQLHEGQFRASGDPYIVHPVAVADLLRDIGASAPVIAAGFLHDVVEDTDVSLGEIETPLVPIPVAGGPKVMVKDEGRLPTGSFKARGLVMAVAMAGELGVKRIAMPTNGNAGAACASATAPTADGCWRGCGRLRSGVFTVNVA